MIIFENKMIYSSSNYINRKEKISKPLLICTYLLDDHMSNKYIKNTWMVEGTSSPNFETEGPLIDSMTSRTCTVAIYAVNKIHGKTHYFI